MNPSEAAPRESSALQIHGAALGLVVAILVTYSTSFTGALVLDDQSTLVENASIRALWPLGPILNPPAEAGVCGRPLANFTLALNYAVSGLDPGSYHAVNVALHLLATLTLFGLVRRTLLLPRYRASCGRSAWLIALASAGLWGLHPVQTNAINYLSQRVEVLMGLFYLLTLYCFVRGVGSSSRAWLGLAVLSCLCGMASKEVMVTAPFTVLLYDRSFLSGSFRAAWARHRRFYLGLAATWGLLAYLMANAQLAQRGIGFSPGISPLGYACNEARIVLRYLQLSAWPTPLVFDYGWDFDWSPMVVIPCVATLATLVGATGWALVRFPGAGFLAGSFFLILSPTSSVVPILQQPAAESRLYLPLAAACTLAVAAAYRLDRRTLLLWPLVGVLFAGLTLHRHADYRDEVSLWADTVAKRPENPRAHGNLGSALVRANQEDEALSHFRTAVQLKPSYPEARNNLGVTLLRRGDITAAIAQLEAAIMLNPSLADAHHNLGEARFKSRDTSGAEAEFRHALRLKPNLAQTHNNLGVLLLQEGRIDEARGHDREAVRLDPTSAEAHYNLGNALVRSGQATEAIACFQRALELRPTFAKACNNLGVALLQVGRVAEAIERFSQALVLQPDYAEAKRNLRAAKDIRSP